MKIFSFLLTVGSAVLSFASAQGADVTASQTPAAATVVSSVSSAPPLFPGESVQLTAAVLAELAATIQNETISNLFTFGASSSNSTVSKRSTHTCKLLPGDLLWPIDLVWDIFDILLGGSLIKAAPLAAFCYPEWPEYNAAKCATITSEWLTSNLQ
jgi:hypothetical protein